MFWRRDGIGEFQGDFIFLSLIYIEKSQEFKKMKSLRSTNSLTHFPFKISTKTRKMLEFVGHLRNLFTFDSSSYPCDEEQNQTVN